MSTDKVLQNAQQDMNEGRADLAVERLRAASGQYPDSAAVWTQLGFALHQEQWEPEAADALARACALDGSNADTAMALAQSRFLAGLPSTASFERVLQLAPHDLNVLRGYTSALAAERQRDKAIGLLRDTLKQQPGWLAGHKSLASLCYTAGDTAHFTDTFKDACARQPENLALWLEWFRSLAQVRDWAGSRRVLEAAAKRFEGHPQLTVAELFVASESGDDERAATLFEQTASVNDVVRDMALIRYSLRRGDPERAERAALRHMNTRSAPVIWPYLSLIWRLRNDPRAEWLDEGARRAQTFELDLSGDELAQLTLLLRQLHTARSPYAEQSVRGGTQTDQNLFLRHEPILRDLRARIQAAVQTYVSRLPAPVAGHPLLGVNRQEVLRGRVHFSGSWSVRLKSQGYNVSHTHPVGWISSALYISLPEAERMGKPPAGWLQFGTPPPELELDLEAYKKVEPKAARLVLFPSTLWHSTVPFDDGERLVVAFDVQAPPPVAPTASRR